MSIRLVQVLKGRVAWSSPLLAAASGAALAVSLVPLPGEAQTRVSLADLMAEIDALQQTVEDQDDTVQQLKIQLQPPVEVTINAVDSGTYNSDGQRLGSQDVVVGDIRGSVTGYGSELRNYAVFDLTEARNTVLQELQVPGDSELQVVEATLYVYNSPDGFASSSDTETYRVNRAGLFGSVPVGYFILGTAGTEGFLDLADGPIYGEYVVSDAFNGEQITIRLDGRSALDDMTFRINDGTDGNPSPINIDSRLFAIGGSVSTLNDLADDEFIFSGGTILGLSLKIRVLPRL